MSACILTDIKAHFVQKITNWHEQILRASVWFVFGGLQITFQHLQRWEYVSANIIVLGIHYNSQILKWPIRKFLADPRQFIFAVALNCINMYVLYYIKNQRGKHVV